MIYMKKIYLKKSVTFTCSKSTIEILENGWNMFKVNNKNVRTTPLILYWCFYC